MKKRALYIFGIIASGIACIMALYYELLVLSLAFFIAYVYFSMIISTPNTDMTSWQKIRYRSAIFSVAIGFIFIVLAISLFFYIFVFHKNSDAEAAIVVAVPLLIGFISLSITATLAYTVREYLSKKVYRWLTVPAIAILVLWSSAFIIGAVMQSINLANHWKH